MSQRFRGSRENWVLECKIYIGNLSEQASKYDVENVLSKYGPLRNIWVARNPPGFAFAEYEDARDADDAVRALDGSRICGSRVRVEKSHGRSKRNPPRGGGRGFGGGGGGGGRDNGRYYPGGGPRGNRNRSRSRDRHETNYNRSRGGRSRSRTRKTRPH